MTGLECLAVDSDSMIIKGDFKAHTFPMHSHAEYAVCVVYSGTQILSTRAEKAVLGRGCFAMLNPNQLHDGSYTDQSGWRQFVLYFGDRTVKTFADENEINGSGLAFRRTICGNPTFSAGITDMIRTMADETDALRRQSLMQEILGLLHIREGMMKKPKSGCAAMIKNTAEIMADAPGDEHTLESLAEAAGMSRFHFLRTFREVTGLTPHAYLTQLRLARAFSMIRAGRSTLADIAAECGFCDEPHLSRSFKKLWGTTPGRIKRK